MLRQIALDTETTGLAFAKGHRIIEIAGIEIIGRQLTGKKFHCYLNPQRRVDEAAIKVHGITDELLADKAEFSAVADDLLEFIKDAEILIHNAEFDLSFLDGELKLVSPKLGKITDYCTITDTLAMARELHPSQRNSLDAICKRYAIDNSSRTLHNALLDAELLARAYLAMTSGQNSLFGDSQNIPAIKTILNQQQNSFYAGYTIDIDLPLLSASADEIAAHIDILQTISRDNGGTCLWLEND